MRIKIDENLGVTPSRIFREAGHDSLTAREQGMSRAKDRDLIGACKSERRCLVTLDLDFANPLLFNPADYDGIAVLRLPASPTHADLIDLCQTLIVALEQGEINKKLWIVQRRRIREYQSEDTGI
jgi:predicted nuclease of predicted toxin-antitoxin system